MSNTTGAQYIRKDSVGMLELKDSQGRRRTVDLSNLNDADKALAAEFGYNPVLTREFGYLSTFSFAVSISGLFSTIATTFYYPLIAGGASAAVWCWLISGAGCMCIALSVSELVSAYPTSGGLYYTISRTASPRWVPSLSWITGWLNVLGQIAGVASSEYGSAQLLLAAASMGSGSYTASDGSLAFNYAPTTDQIIGVMAGLTFLCGLVNSLSTKWMERMTKSYVIFHVLVLVTAMIALLAATPKKYHHSPNYAFTHVESSSGWTPVGFSWLFGFLSVSWTMTDYDATAHIAEEINEPEKKAPWAISMAMLFTYLAGFLYNIVLVFRMGDPTALIDSVLLQPVSQLYYNALGPAGGIFYTVCAFIILQFVCFTATQALARTIFAFSRDKLLPLSKVWTIVDKRSGTPLYAVWIAVFFCIAINLIGLGSYAAISGVFNVTAIALDWSYVIPIASKVMSKTFTPGPWHLGKFGTVINCYAILWTAFVSLVFILPTLRPTTALNMNYAIAFLGGIFIFAGISWFTGGKRYYTGPLNEALITEGEVVQTENGEKKPSSFNSSDGDDRQAAKMA